MGNRPFLALHVKIARGARGDDPAGSIGPLGMKLQGLRLRQRSACHLVVLEVMAIVALHPHHTRLDTKCQGEYSQKQE